MPWAFILRASISAGIAALAACGAWLCVRIIRTGARPAGRDVFRPVMIGYLAALIQIIALRLGLCRPDPLGIAPRLAPLYTTVRQWRNGVGAFIYHTLGNLMWFLPLGCLLKLRRPGLRAWQALLLGAAVSAALEATQYLLGTGICDVDDVMLNALGTLAGFGLAARLPGQHTGRDETC